MDTLHLDRLPERVRERIEEVMYFHTFRAMRDGPRTAPFIEDTNPEILELAIVAGKRIVAEGREKGDPKIASMARQSWVDTIHARLVEVRELESRQEEI